MTQEKTTRNLLELLFVAVDNTSHPLYDDSEPFWEIVDEEEFYRGLGGFVGVLTANEIHWTAERAYRLHE